MALAYATTLRNTMLDAVDDAVNAGAGAGLMRFYTASRPSTCGTATTLLAELTFSDPAFGAASSGTLTASAITQDSSANATGTVAWGRAVDSNGTCVMDWSIATSGSDMDIDNTSINSGQVVSCSSFVITGGNA